MRIYTLLSGLALAVSSAAQSSTSQACPANSVSRFAVDEKTELVDNELVVLSSLLPLGITIGSFAMCMVVSLLHVEQRG